MNRTGVDALREAPKRLGARACAVVMVTLAAWHGAAQQRTSVVLAGPTYSCLPTAQRQFAAGAMSVRFSEGELEDSWSDGTGGLSFFANYRCSGYGGRALTIRFDRLVKNVKLRVITMLEPISVNGAPSITVRGVPWGSTNLDVPGPVSMLTIEGKGYRGPGWGWYLGVDAVSFEEAAASNLAVTLDLTSAARPDGVRMLIAKHRPDDPNDQYPLTGVQIDPDTNGLPRMRIGGFVRDAMTGVPPAMATPVYLRLRDPKDTAPYVIQNHHEADGDNVDASATLSDSGGAVSVGPWECRRGPCTPQKVLTVQAAAGTGRFEAILTGTKRYAGDNYRVEASLEPNMGCATPARCSSTAVITAWKRVYVEINKMARNGSQLTEPLEVGATEIAVADARQFPGQDFKILILHAPRADSLENEFYTEEHTVERVEGKKAFSFFKPEPGKLILRAGERVAKPFLGPEIILDQAGVASRRLYLADGVMWLRGDRARDYFSPDLSRISELFSLAFVETVWLTDDARIDGGQTTSITLAHDGYLPFFEHIENDNVRDWLARKWIRNATRSGSKRTADDNHQALFVASVMTRRSGATKVANGFNDCWVFTQNLNGAHGGKVLAHELAHEWRTNQWFSPLVGEQNPAAKHCDEKLRVPGQPAKTILEFTGEEACLMNSDIGLLPEGANDHVRFHFIEAAEGGAIDSEYFRIRQREQPVPQDEEMDRSVY